MVNQGLTNILESKKILKSERGLKTKISTSLSEADAITVASECHATVM
jgi:hypothetical protein